MQSLQTYWHLPRMPSVQEQESLTRSFISCLANGIEIESAALQEVVLLTDEFNKMAVDKTLDVLMSRITKTQQNLLIAVTKLAQLQQARLELVSKLEQLNDK